MIKLLNIDCYEKLITMESGSVDLFLQDAPFGVTQNKWDIAPDFEKMWPEWLRVVKENCAFIFFATQPFACDLINSMRKYFRYDIIWYKVNGTGFLNANKMPLRSHESILVFYKKLPVFNPIMSVGKMKDKGRRTGNVSSNYGTYELTPKKETNKYFPESVISFSKGDNTIESDHPTQKPLDLIRYLMLTYSNKNDLVFDGYGGSGTTAVAAYMEKRNAIVCENDVENNYYKDSVKRLSNNSSKLSLL